MVCDQLTQNLCQMVILEDGDIFAQFWCILVFFLFYNFLFKISIILAFRSRLRLVQNQCWIIKLDWTDVAVFFYPILMFLWSFMDCHFIYDLSEPPCVGGTSQRRAAAQDRAADISFPWLRQNPEPWLKPIAKIRCSNPYWIIFIINTW